MCGILGAVAKTPVNQLLYDGLQVLQHRGQDAAGIVTLEDRTFHLYKGKGMVRDVFRTRNMRSLVGNIGIAHVRYPTAGYASSAAEAQPFYVNSPFGIVLAHNGNLTNSEELRQILFDTDLRHTNTYSDSEVLLNIFAHELQYLAKNRTLTPDNIFTAIKKVHERCQGAYAVVAIISGYGLVAFRDPYGIRPLIYGEQTTADGQTEYLVASESVALDTLGFKITRDINPGEAVFIDLEGNFYSQQCAEKTTLSPCIFEYVYLARPDSIIDGLSVYETRLEMGISLAEKIKRDHPDWHIDSVIPIPDTSRPSALQLANKLGIDYREGFIKNRYIGRTFIMPGQAQRKKSVRQKLNAMTVEFQGRNVLLVDDSIVRGTTSKQIVQMAREAGALKVYFASAAPPVKFPNVYGIDMPSRYELLANDRSDEQICAEIGADGIVYQDIDGLVEACQKLNPEIKQFDLSCFNGEYVTGNVTQEYLDGLEKKRHEFRDQQEHNGVDLNYTEM